MHPIFMTKFKLYSGPVIQPLNHLVLVFCLLLVGSAIAQNVEDNVKDLGKEEAALRGNAKSLLLEKNFEELDKLAVQYHNSTERVSGGVWKLRHLSEGMAYPDDRKSPEQWEQLLSHLNQWREKSGTAFSLNVLGHCQLNRAWSIRGYSFAGGVDKDNWGDFRDWVAKAETSLMEAVKQDPQCTDAYKSLLHVGISQGWPKSKMEETFHKAIKVAPEYYDYYYNMAFYKMERWYGTEGEWQKFLNSIPDLVPGDQGFVIYARTAVKLYPYYGKDFYGKENNRVQWDKMKRGFETMLAQYPSIFNQNKYAMMAMGAWDKMVATRVFMDLEKKNHLFPEAWGGEAYLAQAKTWYEENK